MSGHVFHPGHHDLHGRTVVIDTSGGQTIVGRFHDVEAGAVRLHDVALNDPADGGISREEFLRRTLKFGVRVDRKFLQVPEAEVRGVTPLSSGGDGS